MWPIENLFYLVSLLRYYYKFMSSPMIPNNPGGIQQ